MEQYFPCNFYLLEYYLSRPRSLVSVLVSNSQEKSNKAHAKLLTMAIKSIYRLESLSSMTLPAESLLLRFLTFLLANLPDYSSRHSRQMVYYYQVIKYLLQQDSRMTAYVMT